jgi:hypothetical protein
VVAFFEGCGPRKSVPFAEDGIADASARHGEHLDRTQNQETQVETARA